VVVKAEVSEANQTALGANGEVWSEKEFDRADTVGDVRLGVQTSGDDNRIPEHVLALGKPFERLYAVAKVTSAVSRPDSTDRTSPVWYSCGQTEATSMPEEVELWKQFCDEASREQDPRKLLKLIDQIEAQLDTKDRLSHKDQENKQAQ
jgi:hypothetical protein